MSAVPPTSADRALAAAAFSELCDLAPEERAPRLAELETADPALARAVRELLALDSTADGPLERLREGVAAAAERRLARGLPGPGRLSEG